MRARAGRRKREASRTSVRPKRRGSITSSARAESVAAQGTNVTSDRLLATSAEAVHNFFRDNSNYFHDLELAAEALRAMEAYEPDDIYATLKARPRRHSLNCLQ
jgi:hypothetical protein